MRMSCNLSRIRAVCKRNMMFFRRPRSSREGGKRNSASSAGNSPRSRISLGICCMGAKLQSKPMQALVSRLEKTGVFEIYQFPEEVILHAPIEQWPVVQGLIAFHSSGFPLEKATEYVKLRRPVELNRLDTQQELRDRLKVYEKLKSYEVPVPNYLVIDHPAGSGKLEEEDDVNADDDNDDLDGDDMDDDNDDFYDNDDDDDDDDDEEE